MTNKRPNYDLCKCKMSIVLDLCKDNHGYGSASKIATYSFAVFEDDEPIAAFAWQPPPPGAAKAVCPEEPSAVLALSRMVAVEKSKRRLRHISKPLRRQMIKLIDRGRWPVLITYHDEGQGHTGHVYKCSGWQKTNEGELRIFYVDQDGRRASKYANGKFGRRKLKIGGRTRVHRWEHWACERGQARNHLHKNGWRRVRIIGKYWESGKPAYRWVKIG